MWMLILSIFIFPVGLSVYTFYREVTDELMLGRRKKGEASDESSSSSEEEEEPEAEVKDSEAVPPQGGEMVSEGRHADDSPSSGSGTRAAQLFRLRHGSTSTKIVYTWDEVFAAERFSAEYGGEPMPPLPCCFRAPRFLRSKPQTLDWSTQGGSGRLGSRLASGGSVRGKMPATSLELHRSSDGNDEGGDHPEGKLLPTVLVAPVPLIAVSQPHASDAPPEDAFSRPHASDAPPEDASWKYADWMPHEEPPAAHTSAPLFIVESPPEDEAQPENEAQTEDADSPAQVEVAVVPDDAEPAMDARQALLILVQGDVDLPNE